MSDYALGSTFRRSFTTSVNGLPTTLSGSPVVKAFEDGSAVGIATGVSLAVDVSGTGDNVVTIVGTAPNGFATGKDYRILVTTGMVGGVNVANTKVDDFSIEKVSALRPATAGRTLVVDAAGLADATTVKLGPTGAGTAQTARDVGASVLVGDKTGFSLSAGGVQAIWDALTSALTTVGSIGKKLADWVTGTPQTGDSFARLGAPANASVSADIAAVKADTAATKAKTDSLTFTVPGKVDSNITHVIADPVQQNGSTTTNWGGTP